MKCRLDLTKDIQNETLWKCSISLFDHADIKCIIWVGKTSGPYSEFFLPSLFLAVNETFSWDLLEGLVLTCGQRWELNLSKTGFTLWDPKCKSGWSHKNNEYDELIQVHCGYLFTNKQKKIQRAHDLQLTPFTRVKEKYYCGIAVL